MPRRRVRSLALLAVAAATALAGCTAGASGATLVVVNEADSPATIDLVVFDRNGVPVHNDRIFVPARSMAAGQPLDLPAGSYSIQARSDAGLEVQDLVAVAGGSAVRILVAADGDRLGLTVA